MRKNPFLPLLTSLLLLSLFVIPVTARRVITVNLLTSMDTSENLGSNATPYVTDAGTWEQNQGTNTITFGTDTLGVCIFAHSDGTATAPVTAVTQTGQTWSVHATSIAGDTAATPLKRLSFAHTVGTGASAAGLTINTNNDNQNGMALVCLEITGATISGTNGVDAILEVKTAAVDATTTQQVTLDDRAAESVYVHAYFADGGGTATTNLSNFSNQFGYTSPSLQGRVQWDINAGADITVATFTTASADGASMGIEIAVAPAGGGGATPGKRRNMLGVGLDLLLGQF